MRHLYDVQQLLQQPKANNPETKIKRKRLFQKIVEDDKKQPGRKDKLFQENPIKRLGNSLKKLCTHSSDFEKLYKRILEELVYGQTVGFSEACGAFSLVADELLAAGYAAASSVMSSLIALW